MGCGGGAGYAFRLPLQKGRPAPSCGARLGLRRTAPPRPCRPLRQKILPASAAGGGRIFCLTSFAHRSHIPKPWLKPYPQAIKNSCSKWMAVFYWHGVPKKIFISSADFFAFLVSFSCFVQGDILFTPSSMSGWFIWTKSFCHSQKEQSSRCSIYVLPYTSQRFIWGFTTSFTFGTFFDPPAISVCVSVALHECQ